jgi:hypothetical protein
MITRHPTIIITNHCDRPFWFSLRPDYYGRKTYPFI